MKRTEISAGQFYRTSGDQIRRVTRIEADTVHYETRDGQYAMGKALNREPPVSLDSFADDVIEKVDEDWDHRNQKPSTPPKSSL